MIIGQNFVIVVLFVLSELIMSVFVGASVKDFIDHRIESVEKNRMSTWDLVGFFILIAMNMVLPYAFGYALNKKDTKLQRLLVEFNRELRPVIVQEEVMESFKTVMKVVLRIFVVAIVAAVLSCVTVYLILKTYKVNDRLTS